MTPETDRLEDQLRRMKLRLTPCRDNETEGISTTSNGYVARNTGFGIDNAEKGKACQRLFESPRGHPGGEYFWQCLRHSRVRIDPITKRYGSFLPGTDRRQFATKTGYEMDPVPATGHRFSTDTEVILASPTLNCKQILGRKLHRLLKIRCERDFGSQPGCWRPRRTPLSESMAR